MGDPTIAGWTATLLYFVAAWLSAKKWRSCDRKLKQERLAWLILTLMMSLLGLNKQLDLQTTLIHLGRDLYHNLSLYEHKRSIELAAFALTALIVGAALLFCIFLVRRTDRDARLALFGLCVIFVYVLLRAARFERLTEGQQSDDSLHAVFEFIGLWVIVWSARTTRPGTQTLNRQKKAKVI